MKNITIQLIYRSYKPLHKIHQSLVEHPPAGVRYIVPKTQQRFSKLFPLYRKIRYYKLGRMVIAWFEKLFFANKPSGNVSHIDLYQYINMSDIQPPDSPYIVDIEHAGSMMSFSFDKERLRDVERFLTNKNCKAITCMSEAANRSLMRLLQDTYTEIAEKAHVIYPAQELAVRKKFPPDSVVSMIDEKDQRLKLLFVGNQAALKGLEETLEALKKLNDSHGDNAAVLYVISADADEIVNDYNLPNVELLAPKFSKPQMFGNFYLPADIFVLPTKQDTFGMAFLDALSAGTPVIATDQFAIPEIVTHGKDGYLVHIDDPMLERSVVPTKEDTESVTQRQLDESLAAGVYKALTDVLDGRIELSKYATQAKKKFSAQGRFSIEVRNKRLRALYDNILK